ncbi:archease [archaeon]|nr:archease [archaeon]
MAYKYIEGLTMADIAFEASGKTLDKMFESAGLAVTNTMVKDLKSVRHKIKKTVKLKNKDISRLLFNFLQEFVYWKDSKCLLFPKVSVKIKETKGVYNLAATFYGDKLDMKKHELIVDVKAVTMHKFEVKKEKTCWKCIVILDI